MALRYTISNNGLRLLQDFLGLTLYPSISEESRDVIFVAIDFENLGNIKQDSSQNLDSQVGIAILDTKILASSQPEKTILTYSFATGSSRYCTATTKKFLFGKTTTIRQQDILTTLESLVPRTRNIALVGHDFKHDLHVLQMLKLDLQTSIVGILDTQKIASELLPDNSSTLSDIQALQCPFHKLHTAGNDAHISDRIQTPGWAMGVLLGPWLKLTILIRCISRVSRPEQPEPKMGEACAEPEQRRRCSRETQV